jgi:hypothetical protein
MHATFKTLPEDPTELRAVSELMAAEIKAQAYQFEKLKKELAGHPVPGRRFARQICREGQGPFWQQIRGHGSAGLRPSGRYRNCGGL